MVGVDDNSYSDHALQWLLDELVDDGDEIVCVRVIETQVRPSDKSYQDAAKQLMQHIQSKNVKDLAISLVVEYAVGKLHNTFQSFVSISNQIIGWVLRRNVVPFCPVGCDNACTHLRVQWNAVAILPWLGGGLFSDLLMQEGRATRRGRCSLNEQTGAKS